MEDEKKKTFGNSKKAMVVLHFILFSSCLIKFMSNWLFYASCDGA